MTASNGSSSAGRGSHAQPILRKIRIGRLDSVGGIVSELGRIYREARRGELDVGDATRLAMVLREIRCALEVSEFERRIQELEAK